MAMEKLTTALVQINTTVGAIERNAELAQECICRAARDGAQLAILPELAICGYPPEDLILKGHFIEDCETALRKLAASIPPDICAVIGAPERDCGRNYNTAAVLFGGKIVARYRKRVLPNYGVFDEKRVFDAGLEPGLISMNGALLALHICEDSWRAGQAEMRELGDLGVSAIINISASPFHRRRVHDREEMIARLASACDAPLLYTNLVGGQDELVFDGASMVADARGTG
jgi:NAD+ synthase (glutamine-hydrolysing)